LQSSLRLIAPSLLLPPEGWPRKDWMRSYAYYHSNFYL
jgi:hypothetical protein